MVKLLTADDLLFASVRAKWLSSPERVVADLLYAVDDPARLDGITTLQVRVEAATVLLDSGYPEQAIAVLRPSVKEPTPGVEKAQLVLAMALGETGDVSGAESKAMASLGAHQPGSLEAIATQIVVARSLVRGGQYEAAKRLSNEAVSAARSRQRGVEKHFALDNATKGRDQVDDEVRRAMLGGPAALRTETPSAKTKQHSVIPVWPTVVDGLLVWWPEAEYRRLIKQIPSIADLLGQTWEEHSARVEATLGAYTAGTAKAPVVVAAEFGDFVAFVERENADPRSGSTMTAYAQTAMTYAKIVRAAPQATKWPPRRRQACWCGSGRRYFDCHHSDQLA